MSAAVYDETFNAQMHYREILDAMARPGKIGHLEPVRLDLPAGLSRGSAYVAHTLLDASVSFSGMGMERGVVDYLQSRTGAMEAAPEVAGFLFAPSNMAGLALRVASAGELISPESAATMVIALSGLSNEPLSGGLKLLLRGPGIETETVLYAKGLDRQFFEDRSRKNAEYPLGIDVALVCDSGDPGSLVACLARTTAVECAA